MKITFILPGINLSGGIRVVSIYAKLLQDAGHQVTLVWPAPQPVPLLRKMRNLLKGRGWRESTSPRLSHIDRLVVDRRVLESYRPPADADVPDADVVVATWWETAEWVNALSRAKGAKAYFIQAHEVFEGLPIDRVHATYRLALHKIVVAPWLKALMEQRYGDRIVDLVPNAVSHRQFFAAPRGKQKHPTLGFLYHLAPFKGTGLTLAAVRELKQCFPDLHVIAFGENAPTTALPLEDWIEFHQTPRQDRLRDLYSRCDVWMSASSSEGFNLPAMEAMACRTPIVASRTGWPQEAIVNHVNGVLVDIDQVAGLVTGAKWILDQADDKWRELSDAAFGTVAAANWESSALLLETALKHASERAATVRTDEPARQIEASLSCRHARRGANLPPRSNRTFRYDAK